MKQAVSVSVFVLAMSFPWSALAGENWEVCTGANGAKGLELYRNPKRHREVDRVYVCEKNGKKFFYVFKSFDSFVPGASIGFSTETFFDRVMTVDISLPQGLKIYHEY